MLKFIAILNNPRHRDPEWHFSHRLWTNKTRFAVSAKCHRFLLTQRDLSQGKKQQKTNTFFQVNSLSTQHNLVLLQHRYSAPVNGASPLPQGFRCPLTSAPFGHDHQRRRAEQRRLAPGDPTAAPPGHRRHPAGHRPHSVYHAGDRPDRENPGDMIAGIFRPPIIRSFLLLLRG